MKCKECGATVNKNIQFCGSCGCEISKKKNNEISKRAQAVIACVCCFSLLVGGTIGGFYFYKNSSENNFNADNNYIALEAGFTDVKVTDEQSALQAIKSVADVLGIENVDDELKISSTNTVDNDTYYRFQQYYKDIPVHGNSLVIAADKEGNTTALTSNYIPPSLKKISEGTNSDKLDNAEKNIENYLKEEVIELSTFKECYIQQDDQLIFSYEVTATTKENVYSVFLNAANAEVIYLKDTFSYESSEVKSEDGTVTAVGWKNDDGSYHLYNDEYKISIFDVNGINTVTDKQNSVHSDFKEYGIDTIYSKNNVFDNDAVIALKEVSRIADFYKHLGFNRFQQIHVAINDCFNNGTNARGAGGEDDGIIGAVLLFGNQFNFKNIDIIAHEYTHAVSSTIVEWYGVSVENAALKEAYSDLFGILYENAENPDWIISDDNVSRNIKNPNEFGYPAKISDSNNSQESDDHALSTIVSHSAYLMWNGIDNDENKKIDTNALAKLWYRSLFLLQSSATFSQCRNAVELSARIMLKNGKLTQEQYNCVCEAFNTVGINNANYTYRSKVKNDFNLKVLNSKETDDVNFKLKIYKLCNDEFDIKSIFKQPRLVFEENSLYGNKQLNLDDGIYKFEITDLDENAQNSESITIKIIVNGNSKNAKDEVVVKTDFSDITTVVLNNEKIDLNTIYLNFLSSKGYNDLISDWYGVIPTDYAIMDINQDGKEELIVSGGQGLSGFYSFAIFGYDEGNDSVFCYTYDTDNGVSGNLKDNDGLLQYYSSLRYSSKYNALMYSATNDGINNHYFSFDSLKDKKIYTEFMLVMETDYNTQIRSYYANDKKIDESTYNSYIDEPKLIEWTKIPNYESPNEETNSSKNIGDNKTGSSKDVGKFYGNETPEELRKSIIGSWGALGSIVPEYNFLDSKNCSGEFPWQSSGTYSISNDKTLTINWEGDGPSDIKTEIYFWSSETWDEFYSHRENKGKKFWYMTSSGVLKINGKEKYRDGVDNFTYNIDGELMKAITGTWINDRGSREYQINSDGTWVENAVVISGGRLITRTQLDNGKVEIVDDTTAKLWQETKALSQIPVASELIYDSKNDKISFGTNNTYSRAKYK